ncbi:MAG TPA: GH1 family beta-glucosidase [Chloroflexota bacterium]|nr:GH1 family beta-glucosidase [Chloroflexota bacterium]
MSTVDFAWGAATAAYQIEGGVDEDGRGPSIWDHFSHTPGKVHNDETGDVACDHYHRWREDVALMRRMGLNAYRFSIAWPRVLPLGAGAINPAGLDWYDRLVDALLEAGIQPWATLYHWDLPQALQDQGGWANPATVDAFVDYTAAVTTRLGDRVKRWVTFNEPWCSAFLGHYTGEHAPGLHDAGLALRVAHALLLAHGRAVPVVRANSPGARVGITLNVTSVLPATDTLADQAAARRYDGFLNRWFLDPLYGRGYPKDMLAHYGGMSYLTFLDSASEADMRSIAVPTDFLGVNYYNPHRVVADETDALLGAAARRPPLAAVTQMGWVVQPASLFDLLRDLAAEYPVGSLAVTENGAAYPDPTPRGGRVPDSDRTRYLVEHVAAAVRAVTAGVPLCGYFAWSLLDNFEWAWGYSRRFGIIHVDFRTQQRTLKDSARWYSGYLKEALAGSRSP